MGLAKLLAVAAAATIASAREHEMLKELRSDLNVPPSEKSIHERKNEYYAAHRREQKAFDSIRNQPQTCSDGKVTLAGEDFSCKVSCLAH